MRRSFVFSIVLAACSGGGGGSMPEDAGTALPDAQAIDAATDAAVDAPAMPSELNLSPGTKDFGTVVVTRGSAPFSFTLANTGTGPTGAVTVKATGAHAADFTVAASSCNDLDPNASCTISIVFAPQAEGARVATLDVSAAGGGSASALLQGMGSPATANLTVSPTTQALGSVIVNQQSAPYVFTVTNTGVLQSGMLSISLANGDVGQFAFEPPTSGDCTTATQLNADASCTVRIRFKPTTTGNKSVQLVVSATPGNSATATLTGQAVAAGAPVLALSPSTGAAFGTITVGQTSAPTLFTVTNTGQSTSSTVTVLSSSPRFVVSSDNCSTTTLTASADCTFTVAYSPTIAGGANGQANDSGTLTVSATQGGTLTANLTGTGRATLNATVDATGAAGRITSTPIGIDCTTGTCSAAFTTNTVVLTAIAGASSGFSGWTGACAGQTGSTCSLTMDGTKTASAVFVPLRRLTVVASGGTVTSSPSGISCASDCTEDYNDGTIVMLTATPSTGYRFGSWSVAGCSGPTCTVLMNAARTVTATFVKQYDLTVVAQDLGVASGSSVTVTPSIGAPSTCTATTAAGTTCTFTYDTGVDVVLSRTLGANTAFDGWTGACSGTGGCGPLVMDQNRSVTGRFAAYRVVITIAGNGKVALSPTSSGALCPDDSCTPVYSGGTSVSLTPQPASGSLFWGWGAGNCTGTTACTLSMNANKTALAEFRAARTLSVSKTGSGTITSSPAGISCGTGCNTQNADFPDGRVVTLTAAPAPGYELAAWTNACAGTVGSTCTVTMDAAKSAGVTFAPGPDLVVTGVTCTPDPVAPATTLTCDVTVKNDGTTGTTSGFSSRLALSTDTTIDAGDPQLGTCTFGQLAAGASATVTCSGTVAAITSPGSYYAGAIADDGNVIAEKSESNNTASDPISVARPDLTVNALACTPSPAAPGAMGSCTVTIANAGPPIGTFSYDVRFSRDDTIDSTDPLLATCTITGGLAANSSATATCAVILPYALGPFFLAATADSAGAIVETDEANNTRTTPVTIGTDLVVSAVSCSDTAEPGAAVSCTYTVTNTGTAIGPFMIALMLSSNSSFDGADTFVTGCYTAGLAAGATTTSTCAGSVPAAQPLGFYFLGVIADHPDVWPEWDLSSGVNNTGGEAFGLVGSSGTDIVVSDFTCPATAVQGGPLPCTVTVGNKGPAAAGAFTITIRYDDDSTVSTSDPPLGSCSVAGLVGGGVATVACNVTAPATFVAQRWIAAFADDPASVAETDELNNRSTVRTINPQAAPGTGPDLVVTAMSCPDPVVPGATITCEVLIENRGNTATAPFLNKLVRSTDTTITTADAPSVDCNAPGGIAAFGSLTLECTLPLTGVGASTPYIGIVLDTNAAVAEASETNNTGYTQIRVVAPGVDLDPLSVQCTPFDVVQGGDVICSGVIVNYGTNTAAASQTGLALGAVPIGNCTTPSIPALGSASFDCLGTIPAGSAAGSYTITATADYNVKIAESSETNNAATDTVTVLASTVDLVAQQLACTSVSFAATCAITVSNPSGTAVPSFRLSVRQSQDATITTSDPEIASCTVGISAGGTTTYTCNGTLLTTSVNVGVFVDADLAVTESSEANNQANASGAWRFPDLDITAMTCTISGADNCVVTITNIGGDAAGPFTVVLRGSADSVYDDLDVFVAMSSVTGLSAGASITLTLVGPDSGAYGVAKVDTANTVLESSESNNTGSATW